MTGAAVWKLMTLTRAATPESSPESSYAARELWRKSFHGAAEPERRAGADGAGEREEPAAALTAVPGVGEEAFWVGGQLMGALYVLFLPCIGVAMVLDYAARRVASAIKDGSMALLASVAPQWRPGEAYLAERKRKKAAKKAEAEKTETKDK